MVFLSEARLERQNQYRRVDILSQKGPLVPEVIRANKKYINAALYCQ
ncbi:hypothetical protein HanIR_Chr03g0143631 [Helianthus annuus]|nr:hypothetical protein HanIR_Chr03g0143631 [Helianthus annuus]